MPFFCTISPQMVKFLFKEYILLFETTLLECEPILQGIGTIFIRTIRGLAVHVPRIVYVLQGQNVNFSVKGCAEYFTVKP